LLSYHAVGDGRCRFGNLDRKASAFYLEDFILKNVARILCVFFVLISTGIIILRNQSRGWADKSKQLLPDLEVAKLLQIFADKLKVKVPTAD
jgi:hypothetical protein